jgi:hypothetical protein
MRLLPGQPSEVSGESISSYSLINAAITNPDVLPRVWQVFKEEESPLSGILAAEGMTSKNLFDNMQNSRYKVVKSNHVMYPIKNSDIRKPRIVHIDGAGFDCPAFPTTPGKKQSVIRVFLNNNWARPNEVLELNDNTTQLFIYDDDEPSEYTDSAGNTAYVYNTKLRTNDIDAYVDTELFEEGAEVGVASVLYEQDFSETGAEKYTYDGWGHAYMTLQRVKMSYSGTAAAMAVDKDWYAFQNAKGVPVNGYLDHAEKAMWRRAAMYHEYEAIFGKGSVSVDGDVILKNKKGREIMSGDGLLYQGEGAYEYPYNKWTIKFLESLLRDTYIRSGKDGFQKVAMIGGWENSVGFDRMMAENGFVTQNHNLEGAGAEKGVNNSYSFYEIGGVRIIKKQYRWFDSQNRPNKYLSDGTSKGSYDGFLVPLGMTDEGENAVELIQLRPPKSGSVSGIDVGGEMASSVDGTSKHVLVQSGIISRVKIQRIFRPYKS